MNVVIFLSLSVLLTDPKCLKLHTRSADGERSDRAAAVCCLVSPVRGRSFPSSSSAKIMQMGFALRFFLPLRKSPLEEV